MTARPILSFANRANSIPLLKGLVARCDLVITNDTGARHIAAALGRRVVTIFGSTDPDRTTLDYPLERIVRALVACSPCQKRMCPQPPGPMYHICMNMIHPGQVVLAATELLDSPLIPEAAT